MKTDLSLDTTVLWGYSLKTLLIASSISVTCIYVLKKYFNGGTYKIPQMNLKGKTAVITGGNSGIGAQTVKQLAKHGCSIIIGARDRNTASSLIKQIKIRNPQSQVQFISLDLSSLESVKEFAGSVNFEHIDYLVNNAGVMAIPKRKISKQGFEMQWAVNHLGHFYLTYLLWGKLQKSSFYRIINVSSLAHFRTIGQRTTPNVDWQNLNFEKDYHPNISYSRSKLYNVLFTRALAQRIDSKKGLVASLHPGVVRTQLMRQIRNQKGPFFNLYMKLIYPIFWLFTKNSRQGTQTTFYTMFSDDVENGCYYADCKRAAQNKNVTQQNWNELWKISQKCAKIKFDI